MAYEHGPLQTFEITWSAGRIETIQAHQCILPMPSIALLEDDGSPRRIMFHGEIDGRWMLLLAADERDVRSVRNLTAAPEQIGGAS